MFAYSLGLYEKAVPDSISFEDKLMTAKQTGYDFMEFCVDLHPEREARLHWSITQRKALRNFMFDQGICLKTLSLSVLRKTPLGLLDVGANTQAFDLLERAMELACDLGIQIILINGYDVFDGPSTLETAAHYLDNLFIAAEIAARYGVILGIENAEKDFMNSVSKVAYWIHKVNSPFLSIYGDIGNTANAVGGNGAMAVEDLEAGRGKIVAIHLKDTVPGDFRYTRYGEGHVDFARSVGKTKELGVHIYTAELFYQPAFDYIEEAKRVNRFLRAFFT